jgi:RNA polymerase sigma-70 factor (ECF subfamily)
VDHFRRTGRPQEKLTQDVDALAEELSGPSHESPDEQLAESQLRTDFRRALDELPAEQRDVFLLYEETGLGLEDIGRITGVAMETAKSRLRYALGKLRGALRQHQPTTVQSSVSS